MTKAVGRERNGVDGASFSTVEVNCIQDKESACVGLGLAGPGTPSPSTNQTVLVEVVKR